MISAYTENIIMTLKQLVHVYRVSADVIVLHASQTLSRGEERVFNMLLVQLVRLFFY